MKLLHILCLGSLLWLTGCASTGISTPSASQTFNGATGPGGAVDGPTVRARPAQAGGDLLPITAATAASGAVMPLLPPADLWERIRRGYAMPDLDNPLVHDREQWYSQRADYILRMTERSRKYIFHIVEELERRNMPTELALLPFVESAFNPQAVSSAKAAGMWQFMPATGKTFELKQNAFRDDRRDVLASTRAALDYLQKLYGMFGDWQLALAAYNWGEGSVARAIAKNQRAGLGTRYSDLTMPMETRFYVPKLQAMKNIVANPQAFNSSLPQIGNHPYFQTVDITRDIDVALAAKLAEVALEDFKALNPSASRPVILAAGTPQILLPWDNAVIFQNNLQAYGGGRLASWTVWLAPATMRPADAAKRVGMSEALLRSVNNIPPRMVIKAGSSLLVPRSTRFELDVALQVADHGQLSLASEPVAKKVKKGKGGKTPRATADKGKAAPALAGHKAAKPARTAKRKTKAPV
jgi:membrane-bound lytic murein transglycosylase D